jgi:hypothetical protein
MTERRLRVIQRSGSSNESDLLSILDAATIRVLLPAGEVSWRHQVLAEALVDLLSRLFPRLDIVCDPKAPAAADLPPGSGSRIRASARSARARRCACVAGGAGPEHRHWRGRGG